MYQVIQKLLFFYFVLPGLVVLFILPKMFSARWRSRPGAVEEEQRCGMSCKSASFLRRSFYELAAHRVIKAIK
jgi:hypothetical protein